ncbi:MAG: glycerol-3-phosphate acyltransferase [Oscillospiraceae bacterium]|nr:glycerol-3-phosphate acyltransferase [Oscillospiraceae bacterium]
MTRCISLLIGYMLGNFLTAEAVSRLMAGKSAFSMGSGNPGMLNTVRNLGKGWGVVVLAGDFAKTALACALSAALFPAAWETAVTYGGLGAVLGHLFPFWHRFRGGKGVACTGTAALCRSLIWGGAACLAGLAAVLIVPRHKTAAGALVIPAVFSLLSFRCFGPETGCIWLILTALSLWAFRADWKG